MVKGLNPTGIEWVDLVWNVVTGCRHGCPYCYAEKMAKRLAGRSGIAGSPGRS